MKTLFQNKDIRIYFESIKKAIQNETEHISDQEISDCDRHGPGKSLTDKYIIRPIILHEDRVEQSREKTKIKLYDYSKIYDGEKINYYYVDGIKITFKVPFSGDACLFDLQPSTVLTRTIEVAGFKPSSADEDGYLEFSIDYRVKELAQRGDAAEAFISERFSNCFMAHRTMTAYVNKDVETFNKTLPAFVDSVLENRKINRSLR